MVTNTAEHLGLKSRKNDIKQLYYTKLHKELRYEGNFCWSYSLKISMMLNVTTSMRRVYLNSKLD